MAANTKLQELEAALAADKELAARFLEALGGAKEAGAGSDSEAVAHAAAVVGFDITPEEVERHTAQAQELDEAELEAVDGGENCNEAGNVCILTAECYTALLHVDYPDTEGGRDLKEHRPCWADFCCVFINK